MILNISVIENLGRAIFSPQNWQMTMPTFFYPLIVMSFNLDYKMAGLNASFFYYHHLLVIYLISRVTFIWLRSYIGNTRALLAGLLFLAGIPTFIIANQLMTRHYVEGLFFVVIYLICCRKMEHSFWHRWTGALFLFLALMEKEIFLIFLLYPFFEYKNRSFLRQSSILLPAIMSTAVFFVWRTMMIKGIGGYGYPDESVWSKLLGFLSSIGKVFFGEGWLALFAAGSVAFVLIFTIFIYRHRSIVNPLLKITGGTCIVIFSFLPAILTINDPQKEYTIFTYHRYLFISWWAFSCLLMSLPNIFASSPARQVKVVSKKNKLRIGMMSFFVLLIILFLSIQNQTNHLFITSKSSIENLYRYAVGSGAGHTLNYPDKESLWYFDLQLQSLATVYMLPRLRLEYKDNYAVGGGSDIVDWYFDPSCPCFKIKKQD